MTGPVPIPAPRLLVVRLPNPAGDVVQATPALRALRRALPDTRIIWSGRPPALTLLDGLHDRDETRAIDGDLRHGLGKDVRLGRAWRLTGADAVLLFPNSIGAAVAAWSSRIPVRVGYARHGRRALLSHPIPPLRDGRRVRPEPMRTYYLRLASLFGGTDDGQGTRLAITTEGEVRARQRLAEAHVGDRFFTVSPGAAFGPSKVYPPALLAEAVHCVREATGLVPVVLCGPGEEAIAADLAARVGPPVVPTHASVARWPEAKAILARSALLLTTDAGPRHVAAALGVPVVCIMGPTDPRWSLGDRATTTVVRNEAIPCLGCHLKSCPIGHGCMLELPPEAVVEACLDRLGAG
ncbi:MAG TPA: glycosyltransferase family 9 protein, partial [Planctomycetota bacterium]|nr:glycosyltransferase family 9 protein [Planctomycetota bacterium]